MTGTLHEVQYTFFIITCSLLLTMKNVADNSCREYQNVADNSCWEYQNVADNSCREYQNTLFIQ